MCRRMESIDRSIAIAINRKSIHIGIMAIIELIVNISSIYLWSSCSVATPHTHTSSNILLLFGIFFSVCLFILIILMMIMIMAEWWTWTNSSFFYLLFDQEKGVYVLLSSHSKYHVLRYWLSISINIYTKKITNYTISIWLAKFIIFKIHFFHYKHSFFSVTETTKLLLNCINQHLFFVDHFNSRYQQVKNMETKSICFSFFDENYHYHWK